MDIFELFGAKVIGAKIVISCGYDLCELDWEQYYETIWTNWTVVKLRQDFDAWF